MDVLDLQFKSEEFDLVVDKGPYLLPSARKQGHRQHTEFWIKLRWSEHLCCF